MTFTTNVMPRRFGAGAPRGATMFERLKEEHPDKVTTFCPDCELDILSSDFIAHREAEHPPSPKTVAVEGIKSKTAFGYDPPDPED